VQPDHACDRLWPGQQAQLCDDALVVVQDVDIRPVGADALDIWAMSKPDEIRPKKGWGGSRLFHIKMICYIEDGYFSVKIKHINNDNEKQ
jgi:hypothetical protein